MCLLKYELNCEQNFSPFFIFQSGLTVTGVARVYCSFCSLQFMDAEMGIRGNLASPAPDGLSEKIKIEKGN
jgi:hypothetical protein